MNHRPQPLQLYVSGVVAAGGACAAFVLITGAGTLPRLLEPELALFALCAMLGELVPLKVHTRGSEGEVTASTCFALALMLAGGPAIAMAGLLAASVLADTVNRKPAPQGGVQRRPVRDRGRRGRAACSRSRPTSRAPARCPSARRPARRPRRRAPSSSSSTACSSPGRRARPGRTRSAATCHRPLLPGLDRRHPARPLARRRHRRRVLAARAAAPAAAAPRGAPRRPRGDREGAPGAARRAHRPAEPHAVPRPLEQARRARPPRRPPRARCCSSTSTASRRSTTRSATTPATGCCRQVGRAGSRALARDGDTVARLGGDEFAHPAAGRAPVDDARRGRRAAARARSREPFAVEGLRLEVDASIGIALSPTTATDVETLLQRADVAHVRGQGAAASGFAVYRAERTATASRRLTLAGELRRGDRPRASSSSHYQPKVDAAHRRGSSASRRWCAGSTPSAASSRPTSSSRSPSRPA